MKKCTIPGFCSRQPDCEDLLCPGRPVTLHRVPGVYIEDGGHSVNGGVSFPMELEPEPSEPSEETRGWAAFGLYVLAAITLICVGGVVYAGIRLFASNY